MVKDYAKATKQKSAPNKPKNWMVIAIIAFGMAFPLAMYYLKYRSMVKQSAEQPVKPTSQQQAAKPKHAKATGPQFEFYTLLPQMEVSIPASGAETPLPAKPNTNKNNYVLQVAAFSSHHIARRLQKTLKKLSMHAYIQTYNNHHQQYFRVLVGPYSSLTLAKKQQQSLEKHDIESLLLKL